LTAKGHKKPQSQEQGSYIGTSHGFSNLANPRKNKGGNCKEALTRKEKARLLIYGSENPGITNIQEERKKKKGTNYESTGLHLALGKVGVHPG